MIVEDTAGGISENVIDKVFEPFFTTKGVGKGTGVGLSLSYGIIRDMDGNIEVYNTDNGACFCIVLPVAPDGGEEGQAPRNETEEAPVERSASDIPKVLIVDDEEMIVDVVSDFLSSEGFLTTTAINGIAALSVLETFHADVIVSDNLMPKMNGIELLNYLRQHQPNLPVIISTGVGNPDEVQEIINKGAVAVIRKPISLMELKTAINNALDDKS